MTGPPTPHLRRAFIGGYRVTDVELTLAELRLRIVRLESELEACRARMSEVDVDRGALERSLDQARARESELAEVVAQLGRMQDEAVDAARQRAEELLREAESDAAAIRREALSEAANLRLIADEVLRFRDVLTETMRRLERDYQAVVARLEAASDRPAPAPAAPVEEPQDVETRDEQVEPQEVAAQPEQAVAPEPEPQAAAELFERRLEVDAGPFADFASLSAFEQALARVPNVEDVYIRRLEGERATLDVTLRQAAPVLDDMLERLPYELEVHAAFPDHISVTVTPRRQAASG